MLTAHSCSRAYPSRYRRRWGSADLQITDPENLPPNVLSLRPKNPAIQCAQFFPVGD